MEEKNPNVSHLYISDHFHNISKKISRLKLGFPVGPKGALILPRPMESFNADVGTLLMLVFEMS